VACTRVIGLCIVGRHCHSEDALPKPPCQQPLRHGLTKRRWRQRGAGVWNLREVETCGAPLWSRGVVQGCLWGVRVG